MPKASRGQSPRLISRFFVQLRPLLLHHFPCSTEENIRAQLLLGAVAVCSRATCPKTAPNLRITGAEDRGAPGHALSAKVHDTSP